MLSKIVIIQELFSSYRGPIFDRLHQKYELIVLHGKRKSNLKLITKPYSICVPSYYFIKKRFVFLNVFSTLKRFHPQVVIHQGSPGILSLPVTWLWCKLTNTGFILWTHGFERHQGFKPYSSFRSLLRFLYFIMADGILFYTKERRDFFKRYLPSHKIFYATNTLDTESLLKIKDRLKNTNLDLLKKDLRMNNHFNIVFMGRLLKEKLVDHLLEVTYRLKNKGIKVKTHIIGDGDELQSLKMMTSEIGLQENVIFYGAIHNDLFSGKILLSSDVMVVPGYVGLAINHAYCFELPVITYKQGPNGPFHSPEIDYLGSGKTGLLTKSYDIEDMANALFKLSQQPDLIKSYKLNINKKIEGLKIEKMEAGFIKCIDYIVSIKK